MTDPVDFRTVLDALALVGNVPPLATVVPETTVTDPVSGDDITVPGYVLFQPPTADLPPSVKNPDGTLRLDALLGLLWGVAWQILNRERRTAIGRATVTTGPWQKDSVHEVAVVWDQAPLAVPKDGVVTVYSALTGRVTARVKPDSITASGCVVLATAIALAAPTVQNPFTFEVQAGYDYYPPP